MCVFVCMSLYVSFHDLRKLIETPQPPGTSHVKSNIYASHSFVTIIIIIIIVVATAAAAV